MNVFLARQPIFDTKMKVFAYELLYRSGNDESAEVSDGDLATGDVVVNSLVLMGLGKVTGDRKAFINFTKQTINNELPQLFSTDDLVVEILEDIIPDEEFIEKCKLLKRDGYKLALDDFVLDYEHKQMIDMVDIIKVDFMLTDKRERAEIVKKHKHKNVKFLAEKVETTEEYYEAVELGYEYFQGYFFSKPIVISGNNVKTFSSTYFLLLKELNSSEPDYSTLEEIVQKDMAMSYKLLRLINSAAFYLRNEITSLKHALTMLGFKEIKKWVSLLMIRDLGKNQPNELLRLSLIRAKMCEQICKSVKLKKRSSESFLMGLFSIIDIILNRRLDEVVDELPLTKDIKEALLGEDNLFGSILNLVISYEHGEWDNHIKISEKLNLTKELVSETYIDSIEWVDAIERSF